MDLLDFFSGELPWGKLQRLMVRLPWYSDYKRALEDDAEFWERYYATVEDHSELEPAEGDRPSIAAWDEWRELAAELKDQISLQTISLLGPHIPRGKPKPKFRPTKRPEPAREKAAKARVKELDDALQDEFLGMVGHGDPGQE